MISANFYQPTTYYNNNLSGQSPSRNTLNQQNVWDGTDAQPYFLGWCKLPTAMDVTRFKTEDVGGVTRFTAYGSDIDNVSYTYNVNYLTYFEGIGATYSFLPANVDATQGRDGHLPNKLQVGTLLTQSYCHVWAVYRTSDTDNITGAWRNKEIANIGVTTQIADFNTLLGFLTGDTTVQLTFVSQSNPNHSKTFDLSGADFDDTGYYHYSGALDSGYGDIYLFIARFEAFSGRDYTTPFPPDPAEDLADTYTHAWGMIKTPWTLLTAYASLGYISTYALYFDFRTTTMPWFANIPVVGNMENVYGYGMRFTITSDDPVLVSGSTDLFIDGNVIGFNAGTNYLQIFRMFTPTECLEVMAIQPHYIGGVPHIGEDGAPIIGEFTNDPDEMTPWQLGDITDNDYTDDDRPPYTPGGDGDGQGSNTGSVLRPTTLGVGGTNGFITQYSLTAAQIAEIGRLLWYKFSDATAVEQYVKNYMFFTVSTTGTLNLSNLLDYFVSLRVYPFPLINVPSHAAAGQDMWIGAGIVPLTFSTNLHTINNYADYIDAGSCTIPRYYNDFRDFAHTQIMLYLPYCGTVQLNPADVVGSTLHAQYAVDFATGGVTAYVDCTTWDGSQFVIAVLTGSIGADIPLTASNAAQIAARIAGDALNFAGTVGEAVSSDVGRSAQAIGSAATGDVVGAAIGVANTYAGRIGGALDVAQTGLQIATAEGVKMPMLSGGRGFGSFGAPQTAYVQIRRGIYAEGQQPTQGFKEAYGEAYAKPVQVSSCAGFTVFANVDTSGLQCDAMEREQVKKMMQAGIYI